MIHLYKVHNKQNLSVLLDVKMVVTFGEKQLERDIKETSGITELFCFLIGVLVMQVNSKFVEIHLIVHLGCMPVYVQYYSSIKNF